MSRMKLYVLAAALCLACSPITVVHAQTKQHSLHVVEFFASTCLQTLPDIERIRAAASVFKWKPLDGDMAAMLAPADPRATWQGWAANHEGSIFMVGISKGPLDNRAAVSCTVATKEVDQEQLVKDLKSSLKMRFISDETEAMQRYQAWETNVNQNSILVMLTTFAVGKLSPATISGTVKVR